MTPNKYSIEPGEISINKLSGSKYFNLTWKKTEGCYGIFLSSVPEAIISPWAISFPLSLLMLGIILLLVYP